MRKSPENNLNISSSWNAYQAECPTRLMLDRIADKWTVLVLGLLEHETKRFSTIQREIGGISQKMLTQTLRQLERNGLVKRTLYASVPPKVEYSITDLGATLVSVLSAIRSWAENNMDEVIKAQLAYDNTKNQEADQDGKAGIRKIVFK
jgi:DNA-binding HxlR family transcriptional regulator